MPHSSTLAFTRCDDSTKNITTLRCYGPYQLSVTTTQSGAWGVGGRGMDHDGTY